MRVRVRTAQRDGTDFTLHFFILRNSKIQRRKDREPVAGLFLLLTNELIMMFALKDPSPAVLVIIIRYPPFVTARIQTPACASA